MIVRGMGQAGLGMGNGNFGIPGSWREEKGKVILTTNHANWNEGIKWTVRMDKMTTGKGEVKS